MEGQRGERWANSIFFIFLICFAVVLLITEKDIGVTYDEPAYFSRVLTLTNSSLGFFERFEQFRPPNHGTFMFLFSSAFYVLGRDMLDITSALRLGTIVLYLLFLWTVFLVLKRECGKFGAWASIIILISIPQIFFHSHLLALDFPVMVFFFWSVVSFYRAKSTKKKLWTVITAASLAALLATKITGIVIFPVLFILSGILTTEKEGEKKISILVNRKKIKKLVAVFLLAALFFLVISPQIYKNPLSWVEYVKFHSERRDSVFLFSDLHESVSPVSWLYVPFSLITTMNVIYVWLALFGAIMIWKYRKENQFLAYLLKVFIIAAIVFSSPLAFKGDGPRHFLLLYPFMAVFAGFGCKIIITSLTEFSEKIKADEKRKQVVKSGVIIIMVVVSAVTIIRAHPFESSYFNLAVLGTKGVVENNFYTITYWQDEFRQILPWLNKLPENTSVSAHPYHAPLRWYQRIGSLRRDIRLDEINPDYFIVPLRQSQFMFDVVFPYREWGQFSKLKPVFTVKNNQGVDLVRVFNLTELKKSEWRVVVIVTEETDPPTIVLQQAKNTTKVERPRFK